MELDNSYYEPEVRSGFYVPTIMKRAWAAELEVYNVIADICTRHDIQYHVAYGTLLGTIRHQGFVPWDDDLDIMMNRENFNKFVEIAQSELPGTFKLYTFRSTDNFWHFLARVVGNTRISFEEEHLLKFHGFPYTVGVDVFAYDYISRDSEAEHLREITVEYTLAVADSLIEDESATAVAARSTKFDPTALADALCTITRLTGISIDQSLPGKQLKLCLYDIAQRAIQAFKESEADSVSLIMPLSLYGRSYRISKDIFNGTITKTFENISVPVSPMYDAYLRSHYGNYNVMFKGGASHAYPYFRNQIESLRAVAKDMIKTFTFSKKDLEPKKVANTGYKAALKAYLGELDRLIVVISEYYNRCKSDYRDDLSATPTSIAPSTSSSSANGGIGRDIMSYDNSAACNSNSNDSKVLLLTKTLTQFQDIIVKIGTQLESAFPDGLIIGSGDTVSKVVSSLDVSGSSNAVSTTISSLEALCEDIFNCYNQPDDTQMYNTLYSNYQALKAQINSNFIERKNIVFLPFRAEYMYRFADSITNALSDPLNDIYIVPLPTYAKDIYGNETECTYDISSYDEAIGNIFRELSNGSNNDSYNTSDNSHCTNARLFLLSYDKFDLACHCPDTIYYQNPYDEYNDAFTVPKYYYSVSLRMYCNNIVYIPYFTTDDFTKNDAREFYNMDYYCNMPGVIHATSVVAQSAIMRNTYIEKLCQFAGEDTREIWEQRVTYTPPAPSCEIIS